MTARIDVKKTISRIIFHYSPLDDTLQPPQILFPSLIDHVTAICVKAGQTVMEDDALVVIE